MSILAELIQAHGENLMVLADAYHRRCRIDGGVFESDAKGNKLLMTLGDTGVSVAERTIQSVVSAGYESIVVVTGHDSDKLRDVLVDFDVQWTHNLRYKDGMGTSIAKAFQNIDSWDAALIVLGDMPFVSVATLSCFVRSARSTQIKSSYHRSTVDADNQLSFPPIL